MVSQDLFESEKKKKKKKKKGVCSPYQMNDSDTVVW